MEDETLIDTTWVRLVTTEDGENNAVTGTSPGEVGHQRALPSHIHLKRDVRGLAGEEDVRDGAGGTSFVPCCHSRTLRQTSFPLACPPPPPPDTIKDFCYLEVTVLGYSPISPASLVGQWQVMQLSIEDGDCVSAEEQGTAPWSYR